MYLRFDDRGARDIWLRDLERGGESKLTFGSDSTAPVWSPDGGTVAFASARDNPPNLFTISISGGEAQRWTSSPFEQHPTAWTRDRSTIVYERWNDPDTKRDLWVFRLDTKTSERLPINTSFNESAGSLSPDSRWLAYVTDQSGRDEVWIASFPDAGVRRQISVNGGQAPAWRGDGHELFFVSPDRDLMSASVTERSHDVDATVPAVLMRIGTSVYRPSSDGRRFLAVLPAPGRESAPIQVMLNWATRISRR